jgi:PleD family two-component response regulator
LINAADAAMYHAKEQGRSNYQFFKMDMTVPSAER